MELSHTKLKTFSSCRRYFRYRYIEHRKGSGGGFASMGFEKRLHKALERFHAFAAQNGQVDEDSLLQAYDHFMTQDQKDVSVRDTEEYQEGVEIVQRYRARENALKRVPAFHEKAISLPFGKHTLIGVVDRIDYDGDSYAIRDYKLTKLLPEGNSAENNRQLQLYALLVTNGLNLPVSTVSLYYLRHAEEHIVAFEPRHLQEFSQWLDETVAAIEEATLERAWEPTDGSACSHCPYKSICPAKTGVEEPLQVLIRQNELSFDE